MMLKIDELELTDYWSHEDSTLRGRLSVPLHTDTGTAGSALIHFDHEPGQHHGRHTDSAEPEVLLADAGCD